MTRNLLLVSALLGCAMVQAKGLDSTEGNYACVRNL